MASSQEKAQQFSTLYDQRELAALNCVNAISFVLTVFETQEFEHSRQYLQDALTEYRMADARITDFHLNFARESKKENQSHGRAPNSNIA